MMWWHGLWTAIAAKKGAEVEHREYAVLEWLGNFAEAPGNFFHSLAYHNTVLRRFFKHLLPFMLSKFEGEEALKNEASRTLWSPIINAGDDTLHIR